MKFSNFAVNSIKLPYKQNKYNVAADPNISLEGTLIEEI